MCDIPYRHNKAVLAASRSTPHHFNRLQSAGSVVPAQAAHLGGGGHLGRLRRSGGGRHPAAAGPQAPSADQT